MSIVDKVKDLLGQHGDKVDKVVDKAGDMVGQEDRRQVRRQGRQGRRSRPRRRPTWRDEARGQAEPAVAGLVGSATQLATRYPTPYGASSARRSPVKRPSRAAPASTCQGARPAACSSAARAGSSRSSAPVSASARARATSASKPLGARRRGSRARVPVRHALPSPITSSATRPAEPGELRAEPDARLRRGVVRDGLGRAPGVRRAASGRSSATAGAPAHPPPTVTSGAVRPQAARGVRARSRGCAAPSRPRRPGRGRRRQAAYGLGARGAQAVELGRGAAGDLGDEQRRMRAHRGRDQHGRVSGRTARPERRRVGRCRACRARRPCAAPPCGAPTRRPRGCGRTRVPGPSATRWCGAA